ncbi:MAG: hypothetical protein WB622_10240, partial [Acidobacteriaceae bacterium]
VESESSSSLSFVPSGGSSAVVRVERVHHGPSILQQQAGQPVTVLLASSFPVEYPRGRRVFFTNPVLYGETIAVREVGQMDAPDDLETIHASVIAIKERETMEETRRHLTSAEAVVEARVLSRRAAEPGAIPGSEHDPIWWVAVLRVSESLKGNLKGEVPVRYPASRDVKWFGVPKPREGDEGLFILHRDGLDLGGATLALLHADDFLPAGANEERQALQLLRQRSPKGNRERNNA